jgi:hypothetical protein
MVLPKNSGFHIGGTSVVGLALALRRATRRRGRADGTPLQPDAPRQHPLPQAQVEVVVRSRRSAYRLGDFREIQ